MTRWPYILAALVCLSILASIHALDVAACGQNQSCRVEMESPN